MTEKASTGDKAALFKGKVELTPHPKDIEDIEPRIISEMKIRLAGYSPAKQSADILVSERQKWRESILDNTDEADLKRRIIDLTEFRSLTERLVLSGFSFDKARSHALGLSQGENVDDFDVLRHFGFGAKLKTKKQRAANAPLVESASPSLKFVHDYYLAVNFDPLFLCKEMIDFYPQLGSEIKSSNFQKAYHRFKKEIYG